MPFDLQGTITGFSGDRRPEKPYLVAPCSTNVLFVTSEIADYFKTGGLGEISAFLPRALKRQGHDVRILIPGYRGVLQNVQDLVVLADIPGLEELPPCKIGMVRADGNLIVYIVLCPELYDRDGSPYGDVNARDWDDNDLRFGRLGLAAAEIVSGLPELGWTPDLLHANDWPSAMAPAYSTWRGLKTPSILTVHNLAYQGVFDPSRLGALGIPQSAFATDGVEFHGKLSFLKAGLFYASHVTTVSPTYAREILTPELGCGLDGLLRTRAGCGQLSGILNGIDESYDPGSDPHLTHHFDSSNFAGKEQNASDVRADFGLDASAGPLFVLVSRLVHQKGIDLVARAAGAIVEQGGQVAITGQGEPGLERAMTDLAHANPGAVSVKIGFDEGTARRMYAGSDFLLMPSRFEPCGLSQMYAQRFGSLPIACKTGGLADTIEDSVNGFLFNTPSVTSLRNSINRAFGAFRSGARFARMKSAAMQRPAGWQSAAAGYETVYRQAQVTAPAG